MRRRGRERLKFITTLGTVALLTCGLAIAFQLRPDWRDPLFYVKRDVLVERLAKSPAPTRVIVGIGSSRTGSGFDPKIIERILTVPDQPPTIAFNAAVVGSGPQCELLYLRRLQQSGVQPSLVVLEILPAYFTPHGMEREATMLRANRLAHDEVDWVIARGLPADALRRTWWEASLNPWTGMRFQLLGMLRPKWAPPGTPNCNRTFRDPHGFAPWGGVMTTERYQAGLALAKQEYAAELQQLDFRTPPSVIFREAIAFCRAQQWPCIVVAYPESTEFRAWYSPTSTQRLTMFLDALKADGVDVVDARAWMPNDRFVDGHHLWEPGAAEFSERLARDVLLPVIKPQDSR